MKDFHTSSKQTATARKQVSQKDILQMVSRTKETAPVPEAWKCSSFTKIPPNHKNLFENKEILQLLILKVNDFFIHGCTFHFSLNLSLTQTITCFFSGMKKENPPQVSLKRFYIFICIPTGTFRNHLLFPTPAMSIQNKQGPYCIPKLSDLYDQSSTCSFFPTAKR